MLLACSDAQPLGSLTRHGALVSQQENSVKGLSSFIVLVSASVFCDYYHDKAVFRHLVVIFFCEALLTVQFCCTKTPARSGRVLSGAASNVLWLGVAAPSCHPINRVRRHAAVKRFATAASSPALPRMLFLSSSGR